MAATASLTFPCTKCREEVHVYLNVSAMRRADENEATCAKCGNKISWRQRYSADEYLMSVAVVGGRNMRLEIETHYRPMTMHREHAVFPKQVDWMEKLETQYAKARLLPGLICPHRGVSCAGVSCAGNVSTVVCPGHGLAWNRETGRLVTRELSQ